MKRALRTAVMTLALFGLGGGARGGELFSPPTGVDGSRSFEHVEPVRVAWSCGVGSPGQPVVGRFGLFPPPPAMGSAPSMYGYECIEPADDKAKDNKKKAAELPPVEVPPHCVDPRACETAVDTGDFSADACFAPYDACGEIGVYNGKQEVPTQRPLVEWGMPFYGPGPWAIGSEVLGPTNLVVPKFYVYGDYRAALAQNDLVNEEQTVLAHRLNLELDYWITSTERIHGFLGPFQRNAQFMRVVDGEFINELDFFQAETDTLFFEGDLGQILGGINGHYATFDLPVTFGLVPLVFQNGIWAQDAIVGGAFTLPAQNSPLLDWSNFDVTFFGGFDRISTGAVNFDEDAAALVGVTTFIEARGGYFEVGYGFVDDQDGGGRSYHNLGLSYTRRYANLVSNSVRAIINAGQDPNNGQRTADGVLLLVENTFLTENPYNVLPYFNVFAGFDSPQPLARAGVFGGVLFNTGILFQNDQLTSYPTLDATGNNTYGCALGVDLLSPAFDQQFIIEAAAVKTMGAASSRAAAGDQVGVGARWQKKLSTATLIRADAMVGLLDNSDNVSGARVEYRWKF